MTLDPSIALSSGKWRRHRAPLRFFVPSAVIRSIERPNSELSTPGLLLASGFLNLLPLSSQSIVAALFHAAATRGISPSELAVRDPGSRFPLGPVPLLPFLLCLGS
jgi:hypothetical protein